MITFQDIQKANESIKTLGITRKAKDKATGQYVDITKEYAEVNQRVKAFRMVYPDGTITTDIVSCDEKLAIIKASIYDNLNKLIATGYAREEKSASQINSTSFLENCETSAIGRALGFCGFGIDTSIASYEEVQNAINQQKEKDYIQPTGQKVDTGELVTDKQLELIRKKSSPNVITNIIEHFKVSSLEELTKQQASEVIKKMMDRNEQKNKGDIN